MQIGVGTPWDAPEPAVASLDTQWIPVYDSWSHWNHWNHQNYATGNARSRLNFDLQKKSSMCRQQISRLCHIFYQPFWANGLMLKRHYISRSWGPQAQVVLKQPSRQQIFFFCLKQPQLFEKQLSNTCCKILNINHVVMIWCMWVVFFWSFCRSNVDYPLK